VEGGLLIGGFGLVLNEVYITDPEFKAPGVSTGFGFLMNQMYRDDLPTRRAQFGRRTFGPT